MLPPPRRPTSTPSASCVSASQKRRLDHGNDCVPVQFFCAMLAAAWCRGHGVKGRVSPPPSSSCLADVLTNSCAYAVWEMWHGRRAHEGLHEAQIVAAVCCEGARPAWGAATPPPLAALACACWAQAPSKRRLRRLSVLIKAS